MKLSTNLKLFTKGYSLDDIKALGEIEGMTDDMAAEIAERGITLGDVKSLTELTVTESVKEGNKSEVKTEEPTDYKALFEAERAKVEELQKANINATVGNKEDNQKMTNFEVIENLFKNL